MWNYKIRIITLNIYLIDYLNFKITFMKKFLLFFFLLLVNSIFAKKIQISASEQDAKIYSNGTLVGNGRVTIIVEKNECVEVRIEKVGYLTIERTYCNKKNFPELPKTDYYKMDVDEAYSASYSTDLANVDIEIKTDKSEHDSWRSISQIITSYFDVIEVTDKETGYLRTSWSAQSFQSGIVRTRVIVKLGSSTPLIYKIKLVSEYSNDPKTTVKMDESFKDWDRVLRKYSNIITELQSRLSKK